MCWFSFRKFFVDFSYMSVGLASKLRFEQTHPLFRRRKRSLYKKWDGPGCCGHCHSDAVTMPLPCYAHRQVMSLAVKGSWLALDAWAPWLHTERVYSHLFLHMQELPGPVLTLVHSCICATVPTDINKSTFSRRVIFSAFPSSIVLFQSKNCDYQEQ